MKKDIYNQVLNSALHLFTQKGYFKTSIPDIVQQSGCSTGAIYHHFKDKEGIARALFNKLVAEMENLLNHIEKDHVSCKMRCKAVIKALFTITEQQAEMMEFILYAKHKEFLPDLAPICSTSPFIKMRSFIIQGIEQQEIAKIDPTIAASAVYGGALRIIQLYLDNFLEKPLQDYFEETWLCAWKAIQ